MLVNNYRYNKMARQLYELDHPLYPHKDLKKYHDDNKILYVPYRGSYDDAYNNWYQLVRADHDISGAPKRPIYREVTQIIRLKSSGKEHILYSEYLIGFDHENTPHPFFHTYGTYVKPYFRRVYNYDLKQANTIRSGQFETVYFLDYDPKLIDTLYQAGPDNADIELLVKVGSMEYGGRGIYSYDEFRDLSLEDLARIGKDGKGQFITMEQNVPVGNTLQQLKAEGYGGEIQSKMWKEFQEYALWKRSQELQQELSKANPDNTQTTTKPNNRNIKIRELESDPKE